MPRTEGAMLESIAALTHYPAYVGLDSFPANEVYFVHIHQATLVAKNTGWTDSDHTSSYTLGRAVYGVYSYGSMRTDPIDADWTLRFSQEVLT